MSTWQAVVVEGQEPTLRAFVAGFTGERGVDPASVLLGDDVGLEASSIGEVGAGAGGPGGFSTKCWLAWER